VLPLHKKKDFSVLQRLIQRSDAIMQLKVIKADGSIEEYLHTKLIATINNALGPVDDREVFLAEQLTEALTFFLYHNYNRPQVTSNEILSMVKSILTSTGCYEAAIALSEHHHRRNLNRGRIEVVKMDVQNLSDAAELANIRQRGLVNRWNKSKIITDLVREQQLGYKTARIIASMVEDKIINSQLRCVSCSFIKQLVLSDTIAVLNATEQLQNISSQQEQEVVKQDHTGREARLRQPQNGFCIAEV
jgi:transcriptional regulator NrdR family protein